MDNRRGRAAVARITGWAAVLGAVWAVGCGGGENVITGFGNSGNQLGTDALWSSLADELAGFDATPAVTDEDIRNLYGVVRQHALEGKLEAALVLLKLAEEQREEP